MKVDVAIPRTKMDVFTYVTDKEVHIGDLVAVPLRNKTTLGLIVRLQSKRNVRGLKHITEIQQKEFIPLHMVKLYKWIAQYYLATLGEVLRHAFPSKILKKIQAIKMPEQPPITTRAPIPTYPQTAAIHAIIESLKKEAFSSFLLFGITGSGKTEVYLRSVEHVIKHNGRALLLVPEISMTPLLYSRFKERFGDDVITIHSGLTEKQRRDVWFAIKQGHYRVVIGPRSTIFVPIPDLKIIVVDEEHDASYKEHERTPRYNARDVAVMRAKLENSTIILGSATPQIESYYNAELGKYSLLMLKDRIDKRALPVIDMIDLKKENSLFLSPRLETRITETIQNDEQVILFLNRRGFAPHLVCPQCGFVAKCPFCGLPMVYHKTDTKGSASLSCHICSHRTKKINICPQCHRATLLYRGAGTQRIEEMVNRVLEKVPSTEASKQDLVVRLDRDSARKKGGIEGILQRFEKKEAKILLGTQLVTKGFDFPDVTLVGIVNADLILNLPDFRSSERTFQILTQVSGRSGRGTKPGQVLMQTFHPEQYAILSSQLQDYPKFYAQEITVRQELALPPYTRLILLRIKGKEENKVWKHAEKVLQRIKQIDGITSYGPNRSFYYKIRDKYRVFILIKIPKKYDHSTLRFLMNMDTAGCLLDIDVDPMEVF